LIRAWPDESEQKTSGDEAYRVALGADPERRVGSVRGEAFHVTTKSYDAEAAEAYRRAMTTSWQSMKIECQDRSLRVTLGGRLVTDAELIDGVVGHLGLEVTKGSINVRNLRVRRQDRYRDNVPLGVLYPGAYAPEKELGIVPPTLQQAPRPSYTRKAMGERTQGVVAFEAIVERDGSVGDVRIVRGLSDELDASGLRTIKRWHFGPATRHGDAVRCIVDIELSFTLK
jgi:TonB family protein